MGSNEIPAGVDWVKLRNEMDEMSPRTRKSFTEKFIENPLIPIGAFVTAGVLCSGIMKFLKGDVKGQQRMMRLRIFSQFCTISCAVATGYFLMPKEERSIAELFGFKKKTESTD